MARFWFKLQATLFKLHLKTYSVESTYASFVLGDIPADGLYALLRPRQIKEFVALHEKVKSFVKNGGDEDLPDLLTLQLTTLLVSNHRRLAFIVPQVDAVIAKDLEKNILRRSNKKNVVNREL